MTGTGLETLAVVLERPEHLHLRQVALTQPAAEDVVVEVDWSGVSTGTEKLLWSGRMPPFPGMGYPLIPGYETVGRVVAAGPAADRQVGDCVFVPGATCFGEIRGLFGGAAAKLVVPGRRTHRLAPDVAEHGVLLALAATAEHAIAVAAARPDLIVGHGVLGRLIARLTVLAGGKPVVWEQRPDRREGASGYDVIDPTDDERHDYGSIVDVSGDPAVLDRLVARLSRGGEIVLAGFYPDPLQFTFPPAFMREARFAVAAQWQSEDLASVIGKVRRAELSLDGLITHAAPAREAVNAYRTAFEDPACLKMVLDWRVSA